MFRSYQVIAINILYTGLPLIHLSRRCSMYDVLISPPDSHDLYLNTSVCSVCTKVPGGNGSVKLPI